MDIKLPLETQKRLHERIRRFVDESYGQNLGDIGARDFLDFCMKEIGPAVYNQAIADAQNCMQERVSDLENICFATEASYWAKEKVARRKPEPQLRSTMKSR
jgi:uncharacterized protein (DUF2164 family)